MAQSMIDAVAIPRLGGDSSLPASSFSHHYRRHFGKDPNQVKSSNQRQPVRFAFETPILRTDLDSTFHVQ